MSAVAELEDSLRAMLGLKPPGVSGTKINSITALCIANVQSESLLIQKLFTHFKKAPASHKLGVLYVVDNVTRKWLDQAKIQGQAISSAAPDGTFAAGVHRVTELMPILMNDIIAVAPEDQKEKIKKLVDIWEKGQTFPPSMVATFKEKINAPRQIQGDSTTPPGSPPSSLLSNPQAGSTNPAMAPQGMPNIMEALANIARQNTTAAQSNANVPATAPSYVAPGAGAGPSGSISIPGMPPLPYASAPPTQPSSQPMSMHALPFSVPPAAQPTYPPAQAPLGALPTGATGLASTFMPGYPGASAPPPPVAAPAAGAALPLDPKVQQQLALITTLMSQGLPADQITKIVQQVMATSATPAAASAPQPGQQNGSYPGLGAAPSWDSGRDSNGHNSMRSPRQNRGRSRSRSPRGWDARNSPRGRGNDRGYEYGRSEDRDYRQRSPADRREPSLPSQEPQEVQKWVDYDPTLPSGSIKVFSRTLFVGGVTCSEAELRNEFSQYGQVQTCIVNKEKRHAFVKMYFRKDAEKAKEGMENPRHSSLQLRTRWGVGFGPRDCSDYATGVSIIPIHKLTEADRKWMLTAPFGGSGGRPIATGLCVEEPDIEIGAGVSSKAISRRMQTDKGGNHGPKSTRREDESVGQGQGQGHAEGGRGGRWKRGGRDNRNGDGGRNERFDKNQGDDEPLVAGLPPGFTMGPNGITVPPNFTFGA